jgi:site-specific recombinase XerD
MNLVKEELQVQRTKREEQELRRDKRKAAQKLPMRDSVSLEEFKQIMAHPEFQKSSYITMRKKAALILLYTTGLRITKLLSFKVSNMQQLLNKNSTKINIIKRGQQEKELTLGPLGMELINKNAEFETHGK